FPHKMLGRVEIFGDTALAARSIHKGFTNVFQQRLIKTISSFCFSFAEIIFSRDVCIGFFFAYPINETTNRISPLNIVSAEMVDHVLDRNSILKALTDIPNIIRLELNAPNKTLRDRSTVFRLRLDEVIRVVLTMRDQLKIGVGVIPPMFIFM